MDRAISTTEGSNSSWVAWSWANLFPISHNSTILSARAELAAKEGLIVEAASAAPVAALEKLNLPEDGKVVCVATGNGLKDIADHRTKVEIERAKGVDSIVGALGPLQ